MTITPCFAARHGRGALDPVPRMSEQMIVTTSMGSQEGVYVPPYVNLLEQTINIGGTGYHPNTSETDRVSSYTGLDDYDTLLAARHGRGTLDPVPRTSEQIIITTSMGITSPTCKYGIHGKPIGKGDACTYEIAHSSQREQASIPKGSLKPKIVSPSSEIIGKGAAIFTDMTETIY